MSQVREALTFIHHLMKNGVEDFIICPGARNAPLVTVLSQLENGPAVSFYEERSAGFYALGICQRKGRPVAVFTTSGTAAAELLPAMVEAYYQELPLVAVTADRPPRYRMSGAPQTINQVGIFSHYSTPTYDRDMANSDNEAWPSVSLHTPSHFNLCFDEPLIDAPVEKFNLRRTRDLPKSSDSSIDTAALQAFLKNHSRPLVVVSELTPEQASELLAVKELWSLPVYLETHSQIASTHCQLPVRGGDKFIASLVHSGAFDCVIRFGGVPTLRLWRDLEERFRQVPVMNISPRQFPGLSRATLTLPWLAVKSDILSTGLASMRAEETLSGRLEAERTKLMACIERHPLSEIACIHRLSQTIQGALFLGNSLVIREWDLAADARQWERVFANRGTNGIDGLVSTGLGALNSREYSQRWIVIGDLSALYDLNGLWALNQDYAGATQVVIINNAGGQIFRRIFNNRLFENAHGLDFAAWADLFKINYRVSLSGIDTDESHVIELRPNNEHTHLFWQEYEAPT